MHSNRFWRRYVELAGLATEVLGRNAQIARPELDIILYPGNPGNAAYYVPYMEALYDGFGGRASVRGVSNIGQCSKGVTGQVFSLKQQTDHKLLYLQENVLKAGQPPVVLIGHSIGAYIALQNIRQLQQLGSGIGQIHRVVALAPFLQFDPRSWRQWGLSHLAAWPRVGGAAAAGLALLPAPLLRRIVRFAGGGLEEHAVDTTVAMLSYSHVANALHLADHEFRDLNLPTDFPFLQSLGDKVAVVCAPRDTYFPKEQWHELQRRLPGFQAVLEPQQRHGFCVSVQLSRQMAETTLRLIRWSAADLPESQRPHTPEQSAERAVLQQSETDTAVGS